jgi:NAD(P)H-hydrate epimerase
MLPIYNALQLKAWDQYTIRHQGVESIDLMERAATQFVDWFVEKFQNPYSVIIFCGNGNNGGDGLAIARMLYSRSYKVSVVLVNVSETDSRDYQINLEKLSSLGVSVIPSEEELNKLFEQNSNILLIDAILGYGLNREISGDVLKWIKFINASRKTIIAVDVPSGMFIDKMTHADCIHANYTLTFQNPKRCQLITDTGKFCGELIIRNIDLESKFVDQNVSDLNYLELIDIHLIFRPRNAFDWKNKFGHLLIAGGNRGMAGAAIFSATAALKSGCGLCSVYSEECNREIIQMTVPEVIYVGNLDIDLTKYSSLVVGPGMGLESEARERLQKILIEYKKPLVLDADALNCIALENWQRNLNANCILTPHVGEFDRLFGHSKDGFERLERAIEISAEYMIHIILKGKYTAVISPEKKVFFNSTGNPGLAKGGSGDVLSGVLGAYLAQGYSIIDACKIAVYLHGLSADIANESISEESMFPSDVIHCISKAIYRIKS